MDNRTDSPYTTSVTAPKEYPVGYLSDGKQFITAISNAGMENQGWSSTGKTDWAVPIYSRF